MTPSNVHSVTVWWVPLMDYFMLRLVTITMVYATVCRRRGRERDYGATGQSAGRHSGGRFCVRFTAWHEC